MFVPRRIENEKLINGIRKLINMNPIDIASNPFSFRYFLEIMYPNIRDNTKYKIPSNIEVIIYIVLIIE